MDRRRAAGALLALAACIACSTAAPMASNATALDLYDGAPEGCYYNFQHYGEGDRIMTNEPCLNCTCHNRMLMCYLRVCPFTKPIGQDCTVEKRADQCCPIVTCPDVPVDLLTSTSTSSPAEYGATGIGKQDKYGCSIDGRYFPEGSKVPPTPNKPCEHCYCIRNMTTCVMQECTLHVDGCIPIYHKDVCCPVRYSCDHPEDEIPLLDDMTTTVRPTPGFLLTTTTLTPVTQISQDCVHDDQIFADGALIKTEKACEHCYCMKGDIVCVVQECGTPMENEGKNCTSLPPRHGQCCPDTYICEGDELTTDQTLELTTEIVKMTSTTPPRRAIEGSGYRNEPDEPYTEGPIFENLEGSGDEQSTVPIENSQKKISESQTPDLADEMFLTTVKQQESKIFSTTEQDMMDIMVSKSEPPSSEQTLISEYDMVTEPIKEENEEEKITDSQKEDVETPPFVVEDTKVTQEPLLTTPNEYVSSSSSGLPAREDQYDKTDSLLKEEHDVSTVTEETNIQQMQEEITTENNYYEHKVIKDDGDHVSVTDAAITISEDDSISIETTSHHTNIEEVSQPKQTTTNVLSETYNTEKESTVESISTSTTQIESLETSSISNKESEIDEDLSLITPTGRIPGEGDCLLNSITYKNNASVPATNKCHTSCKCINSIVTCDPIICSPPPEYTNMNNCQPMYDSTDSCCPTYICDHLKEMVLPESHSQMSGTESPKPSHDVGCSGDECQVIEDKQSFEPSQTTVSSHSDLPLNTKIPCDGNTECQVTAVKPCEGEDCKIQLDVISKNENPTLEEKGSECNDGICVQTASPKYEDDSLEKECNGDSCRRKENSDVASKLPSPCSGQQCESLPEINELLQESSSQLPVTSEEIMKTVFVDTSKTSSSELYTINPTEKLTTLLDETLSSHVVTDKIDSELQDITTKQSEILMEVTDSSVTKEIEPFTVKPTVEQVPEYSSEKTFEISSTTSDIENKQDLTTTTLDVSTEPSVSEENIQIQITTGAEKDITYKTEKPSTAYPVSFETNSQEYTLSDDQKLTVNEKVDKNVTPGLNENTNIIESYTTESLMQIKDKVDSSEIPSTPYGNEQVTVSIQSKDDSISKVSTEPSTQSPEYLGFEEKVHDEPTVDVIEKTEQYSETTDTSESFDMESKDKYSTQGTKSSTTSIDDEVTTENIKKEESLEDQPTEKTPQTGPESSSQISDIGLIEQNEISGTTSVIPEYEGDDSGFGTKLYTTEKDILIETEKTQEELYTKTPIIDVMESLNGRGTEIPGKDINEEASTVASQTNVEIQTTSMPKISDIDETHPKITTTEKTKETNNEQDGETKTSVLFDIETEQAITDAQIFGSSTLTNIKDEITTEVNKDVNNGGIVTSSIPDKITTTGLNLVDDNVKEEGIDEKKDLELLNKTPLQPDKSTESIETNEISTTSYHKIQSLSTEPSSLLTEYDLADVHQIDVSTSGPYPDVENVTETIVEGSDDVTKDPQQLEAEEKDHLSTLSQTEFSGTPDLSFSTPNPTSGDVQGSLSHQEPTAAVIDNLSTVTLPTADTNKFITDFLSEEITTKLEETITNKPDFTIKELESTKTDDSDKTSLTSIGSEDSYLKGETTEAILISQDEGIQKTTITFDSFSTEKSPESYIDIVTDKVTGTSHVDDTELKTDIPEFTTAKISVTELDTFTVKQSSNEVTDHEENITEESEISKTEQHYTESQSVTDSIDLNEKDVFTERTDLPTTLPTKEIVHEISETTDQILRVTEIPKFDISEKVFTEKSDQTTLGPLETSDSFEENIVNVGETEAIIEYTTESLDKIMEIEDNNNKNEIVIPDVPATGKIELEPVTDKTLPPEIKYIEKYTESPDKVENAQDIRTESPELSLKTTEVSATKDSDGLTVEPNEVITVPELDKELTGFTTEPSELHHSEKDVNLSEQKIPEQLTTEITDTETDKNEIIETTVGSIEKSTESDISDNKIISIATEEVVTVSTPQFITEDVQHGKLNINKQKTPEISTEITTEISNLIDDTKENTKLDKNNQDITTEIPEISTSELPTTTPEIQKDSMASSDLPEKTTDIIPVAVSDENPTERSTESQEISTPKISGIEDVDRNDITTESPESFTTSKSSEALSVLDQTKTMGTSNVIDNEKTSESTLPENYIIDKLTTVKIEPEQNTDIQSTNYETSSKPELVETTSEEELPITVKVNVDGEDKTFAHTTEPFAQTIKEISTNLHEDKTEKYAPTAHSADEFFTTSEKYQTFSHKYHDYTTIPESFVTQKSESETQSPLSLSTEKQSYFTTEEQQINDGQIDNTPDHNKYITKPDDTSTTELPASITTTRDDYSKPVTDTKDEHTDTTPYLVELEEHTHKRPQEVSSEIYNEMEVSTVKYDTSFSDIDEDGITTEKQLLAGHESQTDSSIKETADTSKEDIDVTTPFLLIDKKDILQTTTMTHDVVTESSTQFEKLTTPPSLVVHTENDVQTTSILTEKVGTTFVPEVITVIYENEVTPKQEEPSVVTEKEKESDEKAHTPYDSVTSSPEITTLESELVSAVANKTTIKSAEDAITLSPIPFDKFTRPEDKPTESVPSLSTSELHKPGFNEMLPTDDIPSTDEDNHFPPTGSSGYGQEPDYGEEDQAFGPGTCRYGGKVYVSAQQIPRDDPCDFCFCFRSDIICLQQSCPPPIHGCHEEPIQGFCCPRYECPVSMAMTLNITTTTTTTTTTLPPHFLPHAYKGAAQRRGCQIKGHTYKVGEVVRASSGPCLHCTCGGDGQMKCDPKACTPEPILRQMIAAAVSARRRR